MNYDKLDPEEYNKRYHMIPKEIYMEEHWNPLIEKIIENTVKIEKF